MGADTAGIGIDYYIRVAPSAVGEPTGASGPGSAVQHAAPAHRRRRRRGRLRPVHVVVLGAVVLVGWGATTEGGIGARIDSVIHRGQEAVEGATEDSSLRQAAAALNARFDRDGSYPVITEELLRDDPGLSWGVGVDASWCSPRSVVLSGLTGHGTISRLLADGVVVGDVDGAEACPQNLADPSPWRR